VAVVIQGGTYGVYKFDLDEKKLFALFDSHDIRTCFMYMVCVGKKC
jgi:hypothetical protein